MPRNYVRKPKTKMMPCKHCGMPMEVGWKQKKAPNHVTCGIQYMADYQTQMHNHSGPLYEEWRERMRRAFAEPGTATLGSPENVERST